MEKGWQTVLRSGQIYGPYEARIVLHQGNTEVNGPHQGAYVDAPDGSEWFLHFQDAGAFGRILHLQPLCWQDDWPFIGQEQNGDGIGEPVRKWRMPVISEEGRGYSVMVDDDFHASDLSLAWQWQANPDPSRYSLTLQKGALALYCAARSDQKENLLWYAPNACTQQLQAPEFNAYVALSLRGREEGDFAGAGCMERMIICACRQARTAGRKSFYIRELLSGLEQSGIHGYQRSGRSDPFGHKSPAPQAG